MKRVQRAQNSGIPSAKLTIRDSGIETGLDFGLRLDNWIFYWYFRLPLGNHFPKPWWRLSIIWNNFLFDSYGYCNWQHIYHNIWLYNSLAYNWQVGNKIIWKFIKNTASQVSSNLSPQISARCKSWTFH